MAEGSAAPSFFLSGDRPPVACTKQPYGRDPGGGDKLGELKQQTRRARSLQLV